jgi:hypothetical protein
MNPKGGKQEPADPEDTVRMLELELMQQRAVRQRAGAPHRGLHVASFIFLFVIILGTLLAFYYFFYLGGLDQVRAHNSPPSPSATAVSRSP